MSAFEVRAGMLHAEDVPLGEIAESFGTPTFVYSRHAIESAYRAFSDAFAGHPHQICYAVKANANLGVLSLLASLGSSFDIVSAGELNRVIKAGGDPSKVVFSGVGKQPAEMKEALAAGIACFNVESAQELDTLEQVAAALGKAAPVSIRVNPDVDARTHPYISTGLKDNKFGVSVDQSRALYQQAKNSPHLEIRGIDCHIGSQILELAPFLDALDRILALVDDLAKDDIILEHIDLGGGLGVTYKDEAPVSVETFGSAILQQLGNRPQQLFFEPGRFIVANAGILLCRVINLKENEGKHFAVVDAAMNDLLRPSLYGAWQDIVEVVPGKAGSAESYDVVGPVCETGDFLGKDRFLNLAPGDLLAVMSSGAYGFAMSSNYNSRNRAAEILVDGDQAFCVRQRESIDDQLRLEQIFKT